MAKRVPKKVQHKLKNNNMKNQDLIQKATDEISSFEQVIVKADNGAMRRFYVKKKEDVIEKAAPIAVATEREKISEKHSFTPEQHKKYGEYYKNAEKEHGHNSEDLGGEKADKIFHSQAKKSFGKDYGNFKKWHENYGNENTTNSEATGR